MKGNSMKRQGLFIFQPKKECWIAFAAFLACVVGNFIADRFVGTGAFYVFYQGIFALGICIVFPLWLTTVKQKRSGATIGITAHQWGKAIVVGVVIAALSTFARMMDLHISLPGTKRLFIIIACMIMSTLFEEIFFRGFLQTRFEQSFGMIPAILLSGVCFSLYHVGYSNVRGDVSELLSLFYIGIFFSISFRITKNIITSYIVNLPQAILTFLGEPQFIEYSKHFTSISAVISLLTTVAGLLFIVVLSSRKTSPTDQS